jgi:hypothetical protein
MSGCSLFIPNCGPFATGFLSSKMPIYARFATSSTPHLATKADSASIIFSLGTERAKDNWHPKFAAIRIAQILLPAWLQQ